MEYEIVWTEPATLQLKEIHEYIADENPAAADRLVARLLKRVDQLQWTPRMGVVYRKTGKYPVRKMVSGKYRIFYRVIENTQRVEILLVWHSARRDPDFRRDANE